MTLKKKIFLGIGSFFVLAFATLAIALSWDSPCPAATAPAAGVDTMRAVTRYCYGAPSKALRVELIPRPTPDDGEVLIKVHAAGVNPAEWHRVTGMPYVMRLSEGLGAPEWTRVGYDMAGTVEAVGANVTRFKVGDEVFGGAGAALSEYVVAGEQSSIVLKPANLTFEEAAGIPIAAVTALQGLRDHGGLSAGQRVLINGASGGVGTYAVQIAKAMGAEVTGVCSTRNVELVRSLGADHVIDYTNTDFTEGDERYDLIFDNVGNHSFFDLERVMKADGTIVTIGGPKSNRFLGPLTRLVGGMIVSPFIDPELKSFIASVKPSDLQWIAELARDGKLRTAIDRRYPLEQAGEALDYIGSLRARGKVIVTPH